MTNEHDPLSAFIEAACVPAEGSHAFGTLDRAQTLLACAPEVASSGIHAAAILGDDAAVRTSVAYSSECGHRQGRPNQRGTRSLTFVSRAISGPDSSRSAGFARAVTALGNAARQRKHGVV